MFNETGKEQEGKMNKFNRRPNVALKSALLQAGMTQRDLAKRAKVSEFYISMNIQGKYIFTDQDRMKIAAALSKDENELFSHI